MMKIVLFFTDNRDESSQPSTAFRAQYGAVAAAIQPDGTPVEIPIAMGSTTPIAARRYKGTTASRPSPRTKTMD